MLKMDLEYERGVLLVRLKGSLKRRYVYKINNYLVPVLKKHLIKNVIINLKKVSELDEAGVDAILYIKCTLKRTKGKLYLCEVNETNSKKLKRLHIRFFPNENIALYLTRGVKG